MKTIMENVDLTNLTDAATLMIKLRFWVVIIVLGVTAVTVITYIILKLIEIFKRK